MQICKLAAGFLIAGMLLTAQSTTNNVNQDSSPDKNLPAQPIGPDDLVSVSVYDSPELSRTIRVSGDGTLRLPMLAKRIPAQGKMPSDLETAIANELKAEGILVDPVVSVSIAEYRSRPISVTGEVRTPTTFQAMPGATLLDAVTRAQGLTDEAGPDIIVTRSTRGDDGKVHEITQRVPAKGLLENSDGALNLALYGGEQIRVPSAGRIYVVGNVKNPGAIKVHETNDATVFKVVAMSQGLLPYTQKVAYIYRKEAGQAGQDGIPVQLAEIMKRKAPDMALLPNDILYIPENGAKKTAYGVLEKTLLISAGFGSAIIYTVAK